MPRRVRPYVLVGAARAPVSRALRPVVERAQVGGDESVAAVHIRLRHHVVGRRRRHAEARAKHAADAPGSTVGEAYLEVVEAGRKRRR